VLNLCHINRNIQLKCLSRASQWYVSLNIRFFGYFESTVLSRPKEKAIMKMQLRRNFCNFYINFICYFMLKIILMGSMVPIEEFCFGLNQKVT
jgi:hypothetical protein